MNAKPTPVHSTNTPVAKAVWLAEDRSKVLVEAVFDESLVANYGAAEKVVGAC